MKRSRQNWVYESSPEAKAGLEFLLEQGGGPGEPQPLHLLQLDPGRRQRLLLQLASSTSCSPARSTYPAAPTLLSPTRETLDMSQG